MPGIVSDFLTYPCSPRERRASVWGPEGGSLWGGGRGTTGLSLSHRIFPVPGTTAHWATTGACLLEAESTAVGEEGGDKPGHAPELAV